MEVAFKTLYKHHVSPVLEYTSFNHQLRRFIPLLLLVSSQFAYILGNLMGPSNALLLILPILKWFGQIIFSKGPLPAVSW